MTPARSTSRGAGGGVAGIAQLCRIEHHRSGPGACDRLPGDLRSLRVRDDGRGAAVGKYVGELLGLDRRVQRRDRGRGAQHAVDGDRRVGRVRQDDEHAIAAAHPRGGKGGCRAVCGGVEPRVVEAHVARDDRLAARMACGRPAQVLAERPRAHTGRRASTKRLTAAIDPKFSSVISTSSTSMP